jgi:LmbE family N-acetylglucosaminyl deacetylase
MIERTRRALVLCPHTDDEFGCAGTVVRLVELGCEVTYVALSRCEASVPQGLPIDTLELECRLSTQRLGLQASAVHIHRFPVRAFPSLRQEILELFVKLRAELSPDLVLMPSSFDTHQDHRTVYDEGFRAFKHCSIIGYEMPQNLISFANSAFVVLDDRTLEAKLHALAAYTSQDFRAYATPEFVRALAHVRGVQCGTEFAEAFEVVRAIVR